MGIRNPRRSLAPLFLELAHYPSWGSETSGGPPHIDPHVRLTTPHGDQKRCTLGMSSRSCVNSLPLMGIRNILMSSGRTRRSGSHYPSWGSETMDEAAHTSPPGEFSLPLMGIRNKGATRATGRDVCSLPLMGDQKPPYSMPLFTYEWSIRKRNADARPPNCAWPPAQG